MSGNYLLGSGDLAKELISSFFFKNSRLDGVFDDHQFQGIPEYNIPYIGKIDEVSDGKSEHVYLGFSSPIQKLQVFNRLRHLRKLTWPSLIHDSALLLDRSSIDIEEGVIVSAGCILTRSIQLGKGVFLNLNCTVGHDVQIGAFSSVMPGVNISGSVMIGEAVFIGTGATIMNGVSIGSNSVVGAGALVNKDVEEGQTVVGVPAKPINRD
jgi:sugar O-acyltransferase (sialic acid O-acetyltransferase NeuD family)